MKYLFDFRIFETNYDVQLSEQDGKLSVKVGNKTYLYKITVDTGLFDLDVDLDKIVKQLSGDFKIDGKLKGIKKQVELSDTRAQKIINSIKSELSKTGKPPKEIVSEKEKSSQATFTLTLV